MTVHASSVMAQAAVLLCKAFIAVLLLAAGGAKLADLRGFASAVRLFLPPAVPRALPRTLAGAVAVVEITTGAGSLGLPRATWLNTAVLGICGCFLAVATIGHARHRGQSCRCFGGLSRSGFGAAGVARAAGLTLAAFAAVASVPVQAVALRPAAQLGLVVVGLLVAGAAYSAAAAVDGQRGIPGLR